MLLIFNLRKILFFWVSSDVDNFNKLIYIVEIFWGDVGS